MDQKRICNTHATVEAEREQGKALLRSSDSIDRRKGISKLVHAAYLQDSEANYIVGRLILDGMISPTSGDREERALSYLHRAASLGSTQGRSFLNGYCLKRHESSISRKNNAPPLGPLVDYNGKTIKINKKGLLTPIDAVLEFREGINFLMLSANICFFSDDEICNPDRFQKAVLEGIREWQGSYHVFGNQPLQVSIFLTTKKRLFDNVLIIPVTESISSVTTNIVNSVGTKRAKAQMESILAEKRSFASAGLRWTPKSRKIIFIQSENGKFDNYEEIKHVAKHEFGHALGLGDLYESDSDGLSGVEKGTYPELDGFYIEDKLYNLVMCDHHGPVSDNDIEMIVLAFRQGKAQLYQQMKHKGTISKALGRGN